MLHQKPRQLYPTKAAAQALHEANAIGSWSSFAEAVAVCSSPADLSYVVLEFRPKSRRRELADRPRWQREHQIAWRALCDFAKVMPYMAVVPRLGVASDQQGHFPWLEDETSTEAKSRDTNSSTGTAPDNSEVPQVKMPPEFEKALEDAFAAQASLDESYKVAADEISVSYIPRNWTLFARLEPEHESFVDGALEGGQAHWHWPFARLEEDLAALDAALPESASSLAGSEPVRLRADARTLTRLRRHWLVLSERFARSLLPVVESNPSCIEARRTFAEGDVELAPALTKLVSLANRMAFEILFGPEPSALFLEARETLARGLFRDSARGIPDRINAALTTLSCFMPIPSPLIEEMIGQVVDVARDMEVKLEETQLDALLVSSLFTDRWACDDLARSASSLANFRWFAHWNVGVALAGAAALQRGQLSPIVHERIASLLTSYTQNEGFESKPWSEGQPVKWWFDQYQARIRRSGRLPTSLGFREFSAPGNYSYGLRYLEHPPPEVNASALWCLWHLLTQSAEDGILDMDEQMRLWPECIDRLVSEGFTSTAVSLFECLLITQAARVPNLADRHEATDLQPFGEWPNFVSRLVRLRDSVGSARLGPTLQFCSALMQELSPRAAYAALQLQTLAADSPRAAPAQVAEVIRLVDRDEPLRRGRLSERVPAYDALPVEIREMLVSVERLYDISTGDADTYGARTHSAWVMRLGVMIEEVLKGGFEPLWKDHLELVKKAFSVASQGKDLDRESLKAVKLGVIPTIISGAKQIPELQESFAVRGINFEVLFSLREGLRKAIRMRNEAAHSEGISREDAEWFRQWTYDNLAKLVSAFDRVGRR